MPNSTRYLIHQQVFATVTTVATANTAEAISNPALPVGLQSKTLVLFTLDRGDQLIDQPGQREKRKVRIVVGAFARTRTADLDVDALHFAARIAMRNIRALFLAAEINAPIVREVQVEPELKETQTDGALLLSAYEIEYMETYPG